MALGFTGDQQGHYNITGLKTLISKYDVELQNYNHWMAQVRLKFKKKSEK